MTSWSFPPVDDALHREIMSKLSLHPITVTTLLNRGVRAHEDAVRFLEPSLEALPDPFLLPDMERAVDLIIRAITEKKRLAIFGDYDVDGVTSTALLVRFFRAAGLEPLRHLPHRIRDGYGLNTRGLEELKQQGADVVITVDTGMRADAEIRFARSLGMEVIVTDHHDASSSPDAAAAVINPKRSDSFFPDQNLCGCGIAFFLAMALRRQMRDRRLFPRSEPNLKDLLDLVAMGTIADMVPLLGVNRILTTFGLKSMRTRPRAGIKALCIAAGLSHLSMRAGNIAFGIAPRINAAGRMDDARVALELLTTDDEEAAMTTAQELNRLNSLRQRAEADVVTQALALAADAQDHGAAVVFSKDWHIGVIGIAASKLVEATQLPAVVIGKSDEVCKGSVRSVRGLNILTCLEACADLLIQFGGHAQAAGLTIAREKIDAFRERFGDVCRKQQAVFSPFSLHIDAEVNMNTITPQLIEELDRFEPFGLGNPEPLFGTHGLTVRDRKVVGKNHLKCFVTDGKTHFDAIGFNMAANAPEGTGPFSIAHCPQFNEWNGTRCIQLKLKKIFQ